MSSISREDIAYVIRTARSKGFKTVELELEGSRFCADLAGIAPVKAVVAPAANGLAAEAVEPGTWVQAPVVGYFKIGRRKTAVGSKVTEGDAICEVGALGIVNEVYAPCDGTVKEILVDDGKPVEYNQRLILID